MLGILLHLVLAGRQDVLEQCLEVIFAEDAALFRVLQDVLQLAELVLHGQRLLADLFDLDKLARDVADQFAAIR